MADIGKLKGITITEAASLRESTLETVEELWLRIAADDSFESLMDQSGIKKNRLIDLLVEEGMQQPGFASAWLKHHWLDVLIFLLAVTFAFCVWRRL
jgi:hypothetical protein